MPRTSEPTTLPEVAAEFGKAHEAEGKAKTRREKLRKRFFELITFRDDELARQTIFYEGEDPEGHVATMFPKWRILKKQLLDEFPAEWKIILEEDPDKKSFVFVNPLDKKVYTRSVTESAPTLNMERLEKEDPHLWQNVTFQPPPPPRELKPLDQLTDEQKAGLREFLNPPKLTPTMLAPRKAKPDELEGLE